MIQLLVLQQLYSMICEIIGNISANFILYTKKFVYSFDSIFVIQITKKPFFIYGSLGVKKYFCML